MIYCMYRYLIGFSLGIYYDCKPIINKVNE